MSVDDLREELEALHEASFAWALSLTHGDRAEAEDVLQTTYWKILAGKARFGGRSALKTWVFGVVRRTAAERRRRRSTRLGLLRRWSDERQATPIDSAETTRRIQRERDAERVTRALAHLTERQRQIVDLVFYHDLSVTDAATSLGISRGSASVHYARAKRVLFSALGETG